MSSSESVAPRSWWWGLSPRAEPGLGGRSLRREEEEEEGWERVENMPSSPNQERAESTGME